MEKLKTKSAAVPGPEIKTVNGHQVNNEHARVEVLKTYKLFIDGKFPRTESGRYYKLQDGNGRVLANICRASRKDFRDAVVSARKAQPGWAGKSAYLKGQILYRIAETLEGRKSQFVNSLVLQGYEKGKAVKEVNASVDRLLYYAGWSDKYQQVFSSVNPVESSHFNFSFPEPTGVVSILAPEAGGLTGLVSVIAPALVGGNSVVVLASSGYPLTAIELAEVIAVSDVPGGTVNLLTGYCHELSPHFASHMDVNAVVYCNGNQEELKTIQANAAMNVKRVVHHSFENWLLPEAQSPYMIMDTQEIKTTWHPIGI